MATMSVPNPGDGSVPGGYPAPTPHAAVVAHEVYAAPSSMPSTNPAPPSTAAYDAIEGLPEATLL